MPDYFSLFVRSNLWVPWPMSQCECVNSHEPLRYLSFEVCFNFALLSARPSPLKSLFGDRATKSTWYTDFNLKVFFLFSKAFLSPRFSGLKAWNCTSEIDICQKYLSLQEWVNSLFTMLFCVTFEGDSHSRCYMYKLSAQQAPIVNINKVYL